MQYHVNYTTHLKYNLRNPAVTEPNDTESENKYIALINNRILLMLEMKIYVCRSVLI